MGPQGPTGSSTKVTWFEFQITGNATVDTVGGGNKKILASQSFNLPAGTSIIQIHCQIAVSGTGQGAIFIERDDSVKDALHYNQNLAARHLESAYQFQPLSLTSFFKYQLGIATTVKISTGIQALYVGNLSNLNGSNYCTGLVMSGI